MDKQCFILRYCLYVIIFSVCIRTSYPPPPRDVRISSRLTSRRLIRTFRPDDCSRRHNCASHFIFCTFYGIFHFVQHDLHHCMIAAPFFFFDCHSFSFVLRVRLACCGIDIQLYCYGTTLCEMQAQTVVKPESSKILLLQLLLDSDGFFLFI